MPRPASRSRTTGVPHRPGRHVQPGLPRTRHAAGVDAVPLRRDPRAAQVRRGPDRPVRQPGGVEPARPGRCEPADRRQRGGVERADHDALDATVVATPGSPQRRQRGLTQVLLQLDIEERAGRAGSQHVDEAGNAERGQLSSGQPGRTDAAALHAGQRGVVEDDRDAVRGCPEVELEPVDTGNRQRGREGCERVLRRPAMVAPMGQQEHGQPPGVAARSGPVTGIANEKVDPTPSSDSAQIRPPCASTTWRAIERPRPVPPAPRVRARSTL